MTAEQIQAIGNLSRDSSPDAQKRAIEVLQSVDEAELRILVQPRGKECRDNAAEVLKKIGYPGIKRILCDLLAWLRDMNWPGALKIHELLLTVPKREFVSAVSTCVIDAQKENDEMWLYWLKCLINDRALSEDDFPNAEVGRIISDIEV